MEESHARKAENVVLLPSMRAWRNWQTRMLQVHMGNSPWGFKSLRPHHFLYEAPTRGFFFMLYRSLIALLVVVIASFCSALKNKRDKEKEEDSSADKAQNAGLIGKEPCKKITNCIHTKTPKEKCCFISSITSIYLKNCNRKYNCAKMESVLHQIYIIVVQGDIECLTSSLFVRTPM